MRVNATWQKEKKIRNNVAPEKFELVTSNKLSFEIELKNIYVSKNNVKRRDYIQKIRNCTCYSFIL